MVTLTAENVREALRSIMDPEIPTASIVDLGIVHAVRLNGDAIEVDLLPTFAGCPALDMIREDVETTLRALTPGSTISVRFANAPPWTTDRISESGRKSLKAYGIAPPLLQIGRAQPIACPYCGAQDTVEESAFGPTPCRTVRYCNSCHNPFEGFKPKLPPAASAS